MCGQPGFKGLGGGLPLTCPALPPAAPRGRGAAGGVSCRPRSSRRREAESCSALRQLLLQPSCFGLRLCGFVRGHREHETEPCGHACTWHSSYFRTRNVKPEHPGGPAASPTCVTWWNLTRPTHRRQGLTRGRPLLRTTPSAAPGKRSFGVWEAPTASTSCPSPAARDAFPFLTEQLPPSPPNSNGYWYDWHQLCDRGGFPRAL